MNLSVVISTYTHTGRQKNLLAVLKHISECDNQAVLQEVMIVDSGAGLSQDEKVEIRNNFLGGKITGKLRIITQPEIGLDIARNTGIQNAEGDIIAFIDDDVFVIDSFLSVMENVFANPKVFCVSGKVRLSWSRQPPAWLNNPYFLRFLAPQFYPDKLALVVPPFHLFGGCMAFRRDKVSANPFDKNLDRKAMRQLSGGDIDFGMYFNPANVFIEPRLEVSTQVKTERHTFPFFIKRLYWQGVTDAILVSKHGKDKIYDARELFFSKGLPCFLYKQAQTGYRYFICAIIRLLGYYQGKAAIALKFIPINEQRII